MNAFACALRLDGAALEEPELSALFARTIVAEGVILAGGFGAMAACGNGAIRPIVAHFNCVSGVGDVRLDNRAHIAGLAGIESGHASDLELVLAAIDRKGVDVIAEVLGDFSFVIWDARAQKLVAARDAFGVKPLFYRRTDRYLLLSSRLEPLAGDERLDREYVADFLIGLPGPSPRTIWQGALQLKPGTMLIQRGSVATCARYWDARAFQPAARSDEAAAAERFRHLFFQAVAQRVSPGETWAQLSGGLDSSAVVSAAEWLKETRNGAGLSGTVTLTDTLGSGDERRFSDAVVARYGLRNVLLRDYSPWQREIGHPPVASDEPSPLFPFYLRDQHMVDTVVYGGGRVLLSGLGSDHYMFGTLSYLADMLATGSVRASARELLAWSLKMRRSIWLTAKTGMLNPMLWSIRPRHAITLPSWVDKKFAREHDVLDRLAAMRSPRARIGQLFHTHTLTELARVSNWIQRGVFQDRIEVRYPFLSRELVEFTLQLPIDMKIRPQGRKWVLREAMRGVLPEPVRTRAQKGGMDARILWTLERERWLFDALLEEPYLAQMGCINLAELRRTVDLARRGLRRNAVDVLSVLALESWLRARANAWPPTASRNAA